jgi:hypothetical protein
MDRYPRYPGCFSRIPTRRRRASTSALFYALRTTHYGSMLDIDTSTRLLSSMPGLAAALRTLDRTRFTVVDGNERRDPLVPMYQVRNGTVADEAAAIAHVASHVTERLRRLAAAYGEWSIFDAPAYFDLSVAQTEQLVKVVERVTTVHVTFFVDQLLPTYGATAGFWADTFAPAYAQMRQEALLAEAFYTQVQPTMVEYWERLGTVIRQARTILAEDVGFLATNSAQEERNRWREWWNQPPVAGLDGQLTPRLVDVPTLTLTFEFALPAHRQPGRLRRLRLNRERWKLRRQAQAGKSTREHD